MLHMKDIFLEVSIDDRLYFKANFIYGSHFVWDYAY